MTPAGPGTDPASLRPPAEPTPLVAVEGLTVSFGTAAGRVTVVEDVSFTIPPGGTVGLVGESGCGKSVTAMSLMRILPSPPSRIDAGRVVFRGQDLTRLDTAAMRHLRGDRLGMIFQEPMTSLNPTFTVGFQITESLRIHRHMGRGEARARAEALLALVGIGAAGRRLGQYPQSSRAGSAKG